MNQKKPLSYSSLKEFAKSPAHYLAYLNREKKSTPAMELGSAIHMSVLEPDKFKERYYFTEHRKNTKAYKELVATNEKMTFLTQSDWSTVNKVSSAVLNHDLARDLIKGADRLEHWVESEIDGVPFKGILDVHGVNYIADLKTTRDGSPNEFTRSAYNLQYHLQAAVYCELTGLKDYWIISAETSSPHNVTPYLVDANYIDMGRELLHKLIQEYKDWDGKWSGYENSLNDGDFFILQPPAWAK